MGADKVKSVDEVKLSSLNFVEYCGGYISRRILFSFQHQKHKK
jgi:hypothetical protein